MAEQNKKQKTFTFVTTTRVNVREEKTVDSSIVDTLEKNTTVKGHKEGNWFVLNKGGYIMCKYLERKNK